MLDENGNFTGFDVIVGNPPYGKSKPEYLEVIKNTYKSATTNKDFKGSTDTFALFIERGLSLLKKDGYFSYIVPLSFTSSDSMTALHDILEKSSESLRIASFSNRPQQIFDSACVRTSIIMLKKTLTQNKSVYT